MKRLVALILACICLISMNVGLAVEAGKVDLSSLNLTMPTNAASDEDEQEGEEGTVTVLQPADQEAGEGESVDIPGNVPDGLDKTVIGRDDRVQVTNTREFPYCAIANMKVKGECGDSWECTGFMVGKNFMLTAAHCMICPQHNKWAKNVTFYFGYQSSKKYLYKYTGGWQAWTGTDFPSGYDFDAMSYDWCFIKLDKNVGDKTGWFGLHIASDSEINSRHYTVAGYRDNKLKYASGEAEAYDTNLLLYDADDVPGNSGGPIYRSDLYVEGIIVAESEEAQVNIGRRFTRNIYNKMTENGYN